MEEKKTSAVVQKLELDLLVLFYNFSDQFGVVDVEKAALWAKSQLGITIPPTPFTLTQYHVDFLIDKKVLPDVRSIISAAREGKFARPTSGDGKQS